MKGWALLLAWALSVSCFADEAPALWIAQGKGAVSHYGPKSDVVAGDHTGVQFTLLWVEGFERTLHIEIKVTNDAYLVAHWDGEQYLVQDAKLERDGKAVSFDTLDEAIDVCLKGVGFTVRSAMLVDALQGRSFDPAWHVTVLERKDGSPFKIEAIRGNWRAQDDTTKIRLQVTWPSQYATSLAK